MLDEQLDRWKYRMELAEQDHQAYIIIHGPGHDGTKLPLREGITSFGRLPSNDVILLGDLVSRHHSRITFFEGRATLQDLGSHNGSWVNGERVATRVLKPGDVARVGNFRLAFNTGPVSEAVGPSGSLPADSQDGAYNKQTAAPGHFNAAPAAPQPAVAAPSRPRSLSEEIKQALSDPPSRGVEVLLKASEAAAHAADIGSYMQDILALALEQLPSGVSAYVHHEEGQLVLLTARGPNGPMNNPPVAMRVPHWVISKNFAVMTDDITSDMRFTGPPTGESNQVAALCAPVTLQGTVTGAIYLSRDQTPYTEADLDALGAIAHLCDAGLSGILSRGEATPAAVLERYFSPGIIEALTSSPPGLSPQTGTIAFCDSPGFEAIAERASPEQLSSFANQYLQQIVEIAQRQGGALMHAQGTKLVLLFGLPKPVGNDEARAITAALEMRGAIDQLIQQHPSLPAKRLRIGMSTGRLFAGPIGSPKRMTYSTLGAPALMAQRLESAAAPGSLLVGESTYRAVQGYFEARKLGLQQGRGQNEPLPVYEILARRGGRR